MPKYIKHTIRKNRKIKFSEENYVENHYINEEGKAVIPIQLDSINDLYMKHDYKQLQIADSVCDYIEEIAYMIPINVDIVLEIHCPEISIEEMEKAKKCIKNNFGEEIDDIEYDIKKLNDKSLLLILFGLLLLIFSYAARKYIDNILTEFLSVIWWIGIWDSVEIQLLDKTHNKWERLNYQQLYDSETVFVFDHNKK